MKKRRSVTAAELIAKLNVDPELVRKQAGREAARLRLEAEDRVAEQALVEELCTAGYPVQSVWDLVNSTAGYPDVVPILVSHVARPYPPAIREGIARALAVPAAKSVWGRLKQMFVDEQDERVKDGLAAALVGASDENVITDVIDLARNPRLGASRVILLRVLERSNDPRAQAALMDLGAEPFIGEQAQVSLRANLRRQKRKRARKRT